MRIPDPYKVLQVEPTATTAEVGRAYRRLMRQYHPDTRPDAPGNEERHSIDRLLRVVMDAYSLLADPVLRAEYDRKHRQADTETARTADKGEGSDAGAAGPDPASEVHVRIEPVSPRDAVWLFPPAVQRSGRPERAIYYLGVYK